MSDDEWDADDFEPVAPGVTKDSVKSSWDDEDVEEEVKPAPAPTPAPAPVPKGGNKEKKKVEIKQEEPLLDPVAEKLRQQRLVEESDLKNTKELFGANKPERSLEGFIPKTEAEFVEYAELLANQLTTFNKSFHYLTALKTFIRKASTSLNASDTKEVAASVTVIANEKLKLEKENTKKKGTKKKQQLQLDRSEEDDYRAGGYDDAAENPCCVIFTHICWTSKFATIEFICMHARMH